MLNNIVYPDRVKEENYSLLFYVDKSGGFSFPCDSNGNVFIDKMTDCAIENYNYCLKHPEKFPYAYKEIEYTWRWIKEPDYGICDCGERIELINQYMGACQCPKCGQWYNLFGQELLPPEKWELDEWGLGEDY